MQTKHHSSKSKHNLPPAKSLGKQKKLRHRKDYWSWIVLAIIILFTAAIRIRLLEIPLESDEGEFAYMGQLGNPALSDSLYHEAPRYLRHICADNGDIWTNDHRNSSWIDDCKLYCHSPFIFVDTLFI